MALAGYEVHPIDSKTALEIVVQHHYLHRRASAQFCFGLFDEFGGLVGVCIYGKPVSHTLCKGIAGPDESDRVVELTRLWIADVTPSNAESFLISRSLKLLPDDKDIVVSFAEISAGHTGIVYQATNWLYTGLSDRHVIWLLDGDSSQHQRHLFDQYGGVEEAKKVLGDRLVKAERPRKHRYVMFRGSRRRVRELKSKLRYEVLPYPRAVKGLGESQPQS
jgi:hypothetical protein